jgi:hypothetical protein
MKPQMIIEVDNLDLLQQLVSFCRNYRLIIDQVPIAIENRRIGHGISLGTSKKYDLAGNTRWGYYMSSKFNNVPKYSLTRDFPVIQQTIVAYAEFKKYIPITAQAASTRVAAKSTAANAPVSNIQALNAFVSRDAARLKAAGQGLKRYSVIEETPGNFRSVASTSKYRADMIMGNLLDLLQNPPVEVQAPVQAETSAIPRNIVIQLYEKVRKAKKFSPANATVIHDGDFKVIRTELVTPDHIVIGNLKTLHDN